MAAKAHAVDFRHGGRENSRKPGEGQVGGIELIPYKAIISFGTARLDLQPETENMLP
jgi:hypothetical protein